VRHLYSPSNVLRSSAFSTDSGCGASGRGRRLKRPSWPSRRSGRRAPLRARAHSRWRLRPGIQRRRPTTHVEIQVARRCRSDLLRGVPILRHVTSSHGVLSHATFSTCTRRTETDDLGPCGPCGIHYMRDVVAHPRLLPEMHRFARHLTVELPARVSSLGDPHLEATN